MERRICKNIYQYHQMFYVLENVHEKFLNVDLEARLHQMFREKRLFTQIKSLLTSRKAHICRWEFLTSFESMMLNYYPRIVVLSSLNVPFCYYLQKLVCSLYFLSFSIRKSVKLQLLFIIWSFNSPRWNMTLSTLPIHHSCL